MIFPFHSLAIRWWQRAALNNLVMGRYGRAEDYFRKIERLEPNRFGLGHNLGLAALAQERFAEAERYFLSELERYGDTFIRFKSLGDMYYIWGKPGPCKEFYSRALPLCESEEDKRQIMHRISQCAKPASFEAAMKSYALLKEGNAKMGEKDYEAAEASLKAAVKADSCNFQAWNNLGALEMNIKKNIEEAVKLFEKAAFYTSLAGIHGNFRKAKEALAKEKKR
ncbi:MAG: tetratricopeptide repeat protein [Spirochaetales bacterium]|jgi:tetratricopeptide (TPR) repeat protein|nr:tetratricopeptide repeat protein [Spirochaetales bacterium]